MKHLNQNPIALLLVLINFLVLDSYSQQHFPLPNVNAKVLVNHSEGENTIEKEHTSWPQKDKAELISSRSIYRIPRAAESVTAADIDLDGDNDIVVGHDYNSQTQWSGVSYLINNGDGTFYLNDSIFLYSWQTHIYAVNTNSNPFPEIIARHFENETQYMAVLENVQDNYVTNLYSMTYGISGDNIGDVNGDGFIDIIIYSSNDQFWGIMYNDGQGNFFQPEYHYVTDYFPRSITCDDLNGDNRDDILVCGQSTEVYFSHPDGFQSLMLETDGSMYGSIIDFDLDGDNDILTCVGIPIVNITSLVINENQGNNTFLRHEEFYFRPSSQNFFVTDFNNDSLADILFQLADHSGYIIYYNQGNFQLADSQFVALPPSNPQEARRNCYCADMDGNGYNDIITLKTLHAPLPDNLSILFNDGNGNFVENPVTGIPHIENTPLHELKCYPNPAADFAAFDYTLPNEETNAVLVISNSQGVIVETLNLNGNKGQKLWDTRSISSGSYIYTLKVAGFTKSGKLVIAN